MELIVKNRLGYTKQNSKGSISRYYLNSYETVRFWVCGKIEHKIYLN